MSVLKFNFYPILTRMPLLAALFTVGCGDDGGARCGADDRALLLQVRDTLAGNGSLNWAHDLSASDWQGVDFAGECVTAIRLSEAGLGGEIPPELARLGSLRRVNLSENELTGGIPPELGSTRSLRMLDLSKNALTGEIPRELAELESLTFLSLNQNELTGGIPPELGRMHSLNYLGLFENELTGEIPRQLAQLELLEALSLSDNNLTGEIPPELGSMRALVILHLSDNRLTGEIPDEFVELWKRDIPDEELRRLFGYREIDIRNNELVGCLALDRAPPRSAWTPQKGGVDLPLCPGGR